MVNPPFLVLRWTNKRYIFTHIQQGAFHPPCKGRGKENMKYNFEQKRNDYETPPKLYNMALEYLGRDKFDLDTCCSRTNIPANHYYINGFADGLKWDWEKLNWCNPPYDQCKDWIKKAYEEQQKGNETMMLIPVRTETKYFHDYILFNDKVKIFWLRKGYGFINPDTGESCGVFKNALALVYFSSKCIR